MIQISTGGTQADDGCNKPNAKYHKRHHESQSTKEFQSSEFAGKGKELMGLVNVSSPPPKDLPSHCRRLREIILTSAKNIIAI